MQNKICIIGRANVGKSTLFNRLTEKRQALVSDIPGTTRDLKFAAVRWQNISFMLIDTGGFLSATKPLRAMSKKETKQFNKEKTGDVDKQVESMARKALEASQLVLFAVDGQEGLNPQDRQIADYLRKIKDKKIILVVNKCDNPGVRRLTAEFHKLGLGEPALISAANGSGIGDLLDKIKTELGVTTNNMAVEDKPESPIVRVAIVGKPNVGKSSLLNKILGEERAIVSAEAHTTREPNDTLIEFEGRKILIADTAGIRRKARVVEASMEKSGVTMSIGSLRQADVALLVLDIQQNISKQDLVLGNLAAEAGVAVIIVANKYDLLKEDAEEEEARDLTKKFEEYIYNNFPHLSWAPIIFISAKTGFNTQKILRLVLELEEEKNKVIASGALNKFLKTIIAHRPPPRKVIGDGGRSKIKRAFITNFEQIDTRPPTFSCSIGSKEKLPEEYRRYIINSLRKKFAFKGVPIKLKVSWKKDK